MSMCIGSHPKVNYVGDVDLADLIDGKYKKGDVLHAVVWTARYSLINEYFPNNRYIFMLRDLRGVVSSMLDLEWSEKYAAAEICRSLLGITDWRKQYEATGYLVDVHKNPVMTATACAYLKSYQLVLYRQKSLNVLPVRYEEFVKNPSSTLEEVLNFLGLSWSVRVLQHDDLMEGDEFAGNDPKRPIDTASVDKWKSRLSESEILTVLDTVKCLDGIFDGFAKDYELI